MVIKVVRKVLGIGRKKQQHQEQRDQKKSDASNKKSEQEQQIDIHYETSKQELKNNFDSVINQYNCKIDKLRKHAKQLHTGSINVIKTHKTTVKDKLAKEVRDLDRELLDDTKLIYTNILFWFTNLANDMDSCYKIADSRGLAKLFIQGCFLLEQLPELNNELMQSINCLLDINKPKQQRIKACALNQAWLDVLCITQYSNKSWAKEHGQLLEKLLFHPNYVNDKNTANSFTTKWRLAAENYYKEQIEKVKFLYKKGISAVFDELMLKEINPCLSLLATYLENQKQLYATLTCEHRKKINEKYHNHLECSKDLKQYWQQCITEYKSYLNDLDVARDKFIHEQHEEYHVKLTSLSSSCAEQKNIINNWYTQECNNIEQWYYHTRRNYKKNRLMKIGNGILSVAGALITAGQSLWVNMFGEAVGTSIAVSGITTSVGALNNMSNGNHAIGMQMHAAIPSSSSASASLNNAHDEADNLRAYQPPKLPELYNFDNQHENENSKNKLSNEEIVNFHRNNNSANNYNYNNHSYNLVADLLKPGSIIKSDLLVPYRKRTPFELVTTNVSDVIEQAALNSTTSQGFFNQLANNYDTLKTAYSWYKNGTAEEKLVLKQAMIQGLLSANIEKSSKDGVVISTFKSVARGSRNFRDSITDAITNPIDTLYSLTVDPAIFAYKMCNSEFRSAVYQNLTSSISSMDWMDFLEHGTSLAVTAFTAPAITKNVISSNKSLCDLGTKAYHHASQFNYQSPIIFKYQSARLNSGIPVDQMVLRNPVVSKNKRIRHSDLNPVKNSKHVIDPARSNIEAIKKLGLNLEQRRNLLEGKKVFWENPYSTLSNYEVFIYQAEKETFKASILAIENSGSPGALNIFVKNAANTAKNLGYQKLEINGINVESRLFSVMQRRYGFQQGVDMFIDSTGRYEPTLTRTFDLNKKIDLTVNFNSTTSGINTGLQL